MGFKLAEPRRPAGLGEDVTPRGALGTDWRGLSQKGLHEVAGCTAAAAGKVVGSSGECSWGKAGPAAAASAGQADRVACTHANKALLLSHEHLHPLHDTVFLKTVSCTVFLKTVSCSGR
eukprot:COSAG02_NODE_224_length_28285_cov_39.533066_2_plen_119_part_00